MKVRTARKTAPAMAFSFFDIEIFLDIILQVLAVFEAIARVFGIDIRISG